MLVYNKQDLFIRMEDLCFKVEKGLPDFYVSTRQ